MLSDMIRKTSICLTSHCFDLVGIQPGCEFPTFVRESGAVAESVERKTPVVEIGSSICARVNWMTYKIDTYPSLSWHRALLGQGKDRLIQHQHYKVAMSVDIHSDMTLDITKG